MYYTVQNVPYIEIERSVSFLEAMYHWKLIEKHIMPVVNAHPESKVAAEFFGDFAFSYVREKRALRQLRKTYAIAEKVLDGELTGSNYELRKPKALVVKEVYESVERAVERNGFGSLDEVFELYDERSEMFFNRLIQRGGKCRNDALYWMAQSYIMDKDFTRFAETWEMIDEASGFPSSYEEKAYAEITQMKSRGVVDLLAYEIRYNSHSPHTEDPYLVKAIKRNTINGLWNRRSQDILRRREQGVKLKFDWYAK